MLDWSRHTATQHQIIATTENGMIGGPSYYTSGIRDLSKSQHKDQRRRYIERQGEQALNM